MRLPVSWTTMRLYDSLTRQVQEVVPADGPR